VHPWSAVVVVSLECASSEARLVRFQEAESSLGLLLSLIARWNVEGEIDETSTGGWAASRLLFLLKNAARPASLAALGLLVRFGLLQVERECDEVGLGRSAWFRLTQSSSRHRGGLASSFLLVIAGGLLEIEGEANETGSARLSLCLASTLLFHGRSC